jgi:hypothetical protein
VFGPPGAGKSFGVAQVAAHAAQGRRLELPVVLEHDLIKLRLGLFQPRNVISNERPRDTTVGFACRLEVQPAALARSQTTRATGMSCVSPQVTHAALLRSAKAALSASTEAGKGIPSISCIRLQQWASSAARAIQPSKER